MKKIILSLVAVVAFAFTSQAQEANNIKINPLGLLIGSINMSYEHAISDQVSLQINPGYWTGFKVNDNKWTGASIGAEGRYYLSRDSYAPDGFYVGPYLSNQSLSFENEGDKDGLNVLTGGIEFGNQWVYDSGFVLDLNLGGGFASAKEKDSEPEDDYIDNVKGFLPKLTFALGYNF